jgi:hypothetical protein
MFDGQLAQKVRSGFNIHTAFSTSALAAPSRHHSPGRRSPDGLCSLEALAHLQTMCRGQADPEQDTSRVLDRSWLGRLLGQKKPSQGETR